MTYDAFEASQESSQPVEIYRFLLGAESFEFTSAEDTVTVSSLDYEPEAIKRGNLTQGPEERDATLEIIVPASNAFATKYISVVPGSRGQVTIQRYQRPDTGGPEVISIFNGFVRSVVFEDGGTIAKIAAIPVTGATSRAIPRFTYSSLCNNVLYDSGCKVDDTDAAFRLNSTITAQDGNEVTVTNVNTFAAGWFVAGFIEIQGGIDTRLILDQGTPGADDLTLLLPFPENVVGEACAVLAGCAHDIDTCDTKFFTSEDVTSNVINYGGFAFVPTKNVFSTGLD